MTNSISIERYSYKKAHKKKHKNIEPVLNIKDIEPELNIKNKSLKKLQKGGAARSTFRNRGLHSRPLKANQVRAYTAQMNKLELKSRIDAITLSKRRSIVNDNYTYDDSTKFRRLLDTTSKLVEDRITLLNKVDRSSETQNDATMLLVSEPKFKQISSSQTDLQSQIALYELQELHEASKTRDNGSDNQLGTDSDLLGSIGSTAEQQAIARIVVEYQRLSFNRIKEVIRIEFNLLKVRYANTIADLKSKISSIIALNQQAKLDSDSYLLLVNGLVSDINQITTALETSIIQSRIAMYDITFEITGNNTSIKEIVGKLDVSDSIINDLKARIVPPKIDLTSYKTALDTAENTLKNYTPPSFNPPSRSIPDSITGKINTYISDIQTLIGALNSDISKIQGTINTANSVLSNIVTQKTQALAAYRESITDLNASLLSFNTRQEYTDYIKTYENTQTDLTTVQGVLTELGPIKPIYDLPSYESSPALNTEFDLYSSFENEKSRISLKPPMDPPIFDESIGTQITNSIRYELTAINTANTNKDNAYTSMMFYKSLINDVLYPDFVGKRDAHNTYDLVPAPTTDGINNSEFTFQNTVYLDSITVNGFFKDNAAIIQGLYNGMKGYFSLKKGSTKNTSKFQLANSKKTITIAPVAIISKVNQTSNLEQSERSLYLEKSALSEIRAIINIYSKGYVLEQISIENSESIGLKGIINQLKDVDVVNNNNAISLILSQADNYTQTVLVPVDPSQKNALNTLLETDTATLETLGITNIGLIFQARTLLVKYKNDIIKVKIKKVTLFSNNTRFDGIRTAYNNDKNTYSGSKNTSNSDKRGYFTSVSSIRSRFFYSTNIQSKYKGIQDSTTRKLELKSLERDASVNLDTAKFMLTRVTVENSTFISMFGLTDNIRRLNGDKQSNDGEISTYQGKNYEQTSLPDLTDATSNLDNITPIYKSNIKDLNDLIKVVADIVISRRDGILSRIIISRYRNIGGIKPINTQNITKYYTSIVTFDRLSKLSNTRKLEFVLRYRDIKVSFKDIDAYKRFVPLNVNYVTPTMDSTLSAKDQLTNAENTVEALRKSNSDRRSNVSMLQSAYSFVGRNLNIAVSTRDNIDASLNPPVKNDLKEKASTDKKGFFAKLISIKNSIQSSITSAYRGLMNRLEYLNGLLQNKLAEYSTYISTFRLDFYDSFGKLSMLRYEISKLRSDILNVEFMIKEITRKEDAIKKMIEDGTRTKEMLDELERLRKLKDDLYKQLQTLRDSLRNKLELLDKLRKQIRALQNLRTSLRTNTRTALKMLIPAAIVAGIVVAATAFGDKGLPPFKAPDDDDDDDDKSNDEPDEYDDGYRDGYRDGSNRARKEGNLFGLNEAKRQYDQWIANNPFDNRVDTDDYAGDEEENVVEAENENENDKDK